MSNSQRGKMMAVLVLGALVVHADKYWWSANGSTVGGGGTWNTATTNWGNSAVGPFTNVWPNSYSDEAVFTNSGVVGSTGKMTLSGTIKAGTLTFWDGDRGWEVSGGEWDFGSGGGTINLPNLCSTASGYPAKHQAIISSPLHGSGNLTVNFAATGSGSGIALNGCNTNFTGKLSFQNLSAYITVTNDFNFGAEPPVYTPDALIFSGGSYNLINGVSAPLTIPANRGIRNVNGITFYDSKPWVVNSKITGSGGVTIRGTTVDFNDVNDYAGGTTLNIGFANNSAKLRLGVDYALPHGAGKGNLDLRKQQPGGSITLDLNGHNVIVNGLAQTTGDTYKFEPNIDNVGVASGTTNTFTMGDNNAGGTYAGNIRNTTGTLNLTKIGSDIQILRGTNSYSGATTVSGGVLAFEPASVTNQTLNTLTLSGGTLQFSGPASSDGSLMFTGGTIPIMPGGNGLTVTNRGGTATLTVGSNWSRTNGASLLVSLLGTGTSTLSSSPTLTNGIVGGYAFVKDATGVDFATVSSGKIVRYTGATLLDATAAAGDLDSAAIYYMSGDQTLGGSATTQTVNAIRLNQADLTMNSKVLVVGSGGIIFSNNASVKGLGTTGGNGTVTAPGGSDLVVYMFSQSSNNQRIMANIADNNGPVGLTIGADCGSAARLRLNGTSNTYSGDTVINGGGLYGLNIPYGSGKGNLVINSGGTADLAAGDSMVNGLSASPGNAGGSLVNTYSGTSTNTLTVGNGDTAAAYPGTILKGTTRTVVLIKVGTGTQTLSGANTYQGGTILSNGVLSVSSTNNIGGANAKVTFAGGMLRISGTTFNSFGATPLTFTVAGGGLEIADAGNSFTLTNNLASGSVLAKTGAGMLTLTGAQAGTISTDDPSKIGFGAGLGFYNLGVTSSGVLSPAGSGMVGTFAVNNNLTLAGKLLVDVTAATCDTVTAGGTITLSSGAALEIVNAASLERSKRYTLMTAGGGTVSGSLTALNLPDRWNVSTVGNTVELHYSCRGTLIQVL